MSLVDRSRSLSKLLGDGVEQLGELFQVELQLAQAELSEKVANVGWGAAYLAAATLFAIPVLTLLLAALALWISDLSGISLPLSLVTAAVIGAALGAICGLTAMKYLRAKNLRPDITLEQIRRDIAAAKDIVK
ncbi:phage holin family protein [Nordella sp. HKS 07]|uniref:phage holin family protein n=1 Tax=Nordella sp. HKS 07 TaxID=2712222 RepID=UPI0013E1D991|nr:phage holin family protein [Nordella sp. HKS 07]QIG49223.1 phage holin family protein [Nordella sp. HKS 07]